MRKLIVSAIVVFTILGLLLAKPQAKIGYKAPEFKLQSLTDNTSVSLSGLKGKVVLVDFWASWCGPCKISMPHLAQLSQKYKNFKLVAVNIDDDKNNAIKFLNELNLDITAVFDSSKKVISAYDVPVMPTAYLVDQYGNVQYIHSGTSEDSFKKLEFAIRGLVDHP